MRFYVIQESHQNMINDLSKDIIKLKHANNSLKTAEFLSHETIMQLVRSLFSFNKIRSYMYIDLTVFGRRVIINVLCTASIKFALVLCIKMYNVLCTLYNVQCTLYIVKFTLFTEIRYRRDGSEIFRVQQSGTDKRPKERASYLARQGESSPSNHHKCVFIIRYNLSCDIFFFNVIL